MTISYRKLTTDEIDQLIGQGCTAHDFSAIEVSDGFDPARVHDAHFSGTVKIGALQKSVTFFGDVSMLCGIYHARIHNCVLGDNVYISNVETYLANYIIEDDVIIEHINLLAVQGVSTFGNGTEVKVLNETGGREVPIYDTLSAQIAYIIAMYRHRPKVIQKLCQMITRYSESVSSSMGRIGSAARLINCGTLKNINVGPCALIEGASRLENASINSCPQDPTYIGTEVVGQNIITATGATISDNSIVIDCFVGQGTELARQYSAEKSLFFANCRGYHGEACAIFAGPFTVTHHKTTLLIAGLFSFLNAGSGSNQSNHMYKLGPVHQGIVERGSKTTSDSYLLWPARIGAFTVVMGRHYDNCDTTDLPYSYLIEHENQSILVPGVNLRSVGTIRDARKWPQRDKRKDPRKLDLIIYNLLNPYTAQRMLNGIKILQDLQNDTSSDNQYMLYNNVKIKRSSLANGIMYYKLAVERYLGNCLVQKLIDYPLTSASELTQLLSPQTPLGRDKWVDIAGLIAPKETIDDLLDQIEAGNINSLESATAKLQEIYDNYNLYQWTWAAGAIEQYWGKLPDVGTPAKIVEMIGTWITSAQQLDNLRCQDAQKEFDPAMRIGFGIDDDSDRDDDFQAVRGSYQDSDFVGELTQRLERKKQTAQELISRLERLS